MAKNLSPIDEDPDLPTKKYVDDKVSEWVVPSATGTRVPSTSSPLASMSVARDQAPAATTQIPFWLAVD